MLTWVIIIILSSFNPSTSPELTGPKDAFCRRCDGYCFTSPGLHADPFDRASSKPNLSNSSLAPLAILLIPT
ncbi:hypothetical protein F5X98DRAFT_341964 [Xylaria grammica]|nr:hypothetical protein F5X98DRAFT_341964 [Xylaria grammica]